MDDTDLARRLDAGIGDPPHDGPPVTTLLAAGHRRVRRRRIATAALTAATVVVIAGGGAALSSGGNPQRAEAPVAEKPTTTTDSPTVPPAEQPSRREIRQVMQRDLVRYDAQCELQLGGERVLRLVDDPYGLASGGGTSAAVELQVGEGRYWYAASCFADATQQVNATNAATGATFEQWIAEQAPSVGDEDGGQKTGPWPGTVELDLVTFVGDTDELAPADGVTIIEQRAGVDVGESYAGPRDRTAAAQVRTPSGEIYFVLARDVGDGPQYIAVPQAEGGGAGLDAFLDAARVRYLEGGGGLL